jgi:hypothetical protein
MSKADHVRAEIAKPAHRNHHCHWTGCEKQCAPAAWGCKPHWYALPQALRNKIWAAYRPGQEATQTPSRRYVEVAREVQTWIAHHQLEQRFGD